MIVKLRAQQRPQLGERARGDPLQRLEVAAGERRLQRRERRAAAVAPVAPPVSTTPASARTR